LWPEAVESYAAASATTPRCVVLGLAGRAAGLTPVAVAEVSLYDDAAAVAAAAPKLGAVDALEAAAWLAGMAPLVATLAERAARNGALPAPATPLLDLRAQEHQVNQRRLFVS
jgi:urease accessory protein